MARMSDLFERTWPVADAKGAVVIAHGLGEHSGRYEHVAQALNAAGYAAYAQDFRGHGQSIGFPGDMGGDVDALVADVVEFCTRVAAQHDRTYLLAHSMGTLFALPAVAKCATGTLRGLILSGTALEPGAAAADLLTNGAVPPETLSRDPEVVKAYVDDPLVWDTVPPEVMMSTVDVGQRARDAIPLIEIPVLLIHGVDDKLTDIQGANYVHVQLVITDKTLIGYDGLLHEILNEPEKDRVIGDVIQWLDAH
jgi:alpha-beta hydrolase superfamily lysophospholipase